MIKKSPERALICLTEDFLVFTDFMTLSYLIENFVFRNGNISQRTAGSVQSLYSFAYLVLMFIIKHYFLADVSGFDL